MKKRVVRGSGPRQETLSEQDRNDGRLFAHALNNSISSFNPDMMMEQMVRDYKLAQHIYGERLIQEITGTEEGEVERNIKLPEYQKHLKSRLEKRISDLRNRKLVDRKSAFTDRAVRMAAMIMYMEELDKLQARGIGFREQDRRSSYGDPDQIKSYQRSDRYGDISVQQTVRTAVRRGRSRIHPVDMRVWQRRSRGSIYVVFALDASGSMRGEKIEGCKKAGIALSYKAVDNRDNVGLIVFGSEVHKRILPTQDFMLLAEEIASITARSETDIASTIREAVSMFPAEDVTKHLIILTDAIPTKGTNPEQESMEAASVCAGADITVSIVGISLDREGRRIAQGLADIGRGFFYELKGTEDADIVVLQDYEAAAGR